MHTKITIALVLIFLSSLGSVALAQSPTPPASVTGVRAVYENGTLTVSWNAVTDPSGIASYRIYFSRLSILQNGGDYDDFEQTTGPETTYTFTKPPYEGQTLYFSVLAVNSAGIESEAFLEEASVAIPTGTVTTPDVGSSTSSVPPSPDVSSSAMSSEPALPLLLTQAVSTSSTGVVLIFSQPLNEQSVLLPAEFVIVDGSGARLAVQSGTYQGNAIELKTETQRGGVPYIIASISGTLQSAAGAPYVPGANPITFLGQGAVSQPVRDTLAPEDVPAIHISPVKRGSTYDVHVSWAPSMNSARDLSAYLVSISHDGITTALTESVSATTTEVFFTEMSPGPFAVRVQTQDQSGNVSQGSISIAQLPIGSLPHTGVGLLGAALVSGAFAGRRIMKRKVEA